MQRLWEIQKNLCQKSAELDNSFASLWTYRPQTSEDSVPCKQSSLVEPPRKYKWSTAGDNAFKFNPKTAFSHPNMEDVMGWIDSIKGVDKSTGGAGGVFFVDATLGTVVIKASRCIAPEVFGSLLAFRLNIFTPRCWVLQTESEAGEALLKKLKQIDPTWRVVTNLFDQAFLIIQDYIPGVSLTQETGEDIFRNAISKKSSKIFEHLGRILVLDILLNNGDRLPLIWNNRGNPSNLIFQKDNVVSIDARLIPLNMETSLNHRNAYMKSLSTLLKNLKEIYSNVSGAARIALTPEFESLRLQLLSFSREDIEEEGTRIIQSTFVSTAKQLLDESAALIDEMRSWEAAIRLLDKSNKYLGSEQLDVSFVESILREMGVHLSD